MEALSGIVPRLIPAPAWKERLRAMKVLSRWEEIVGKPLAQAVKPRGFTRGTLILEVPDTLWMHQLKFEEKRLLKNLNQAAGEDLFHDLRLVLSKRPSSVNPKRAFPSRSQDLEKIYQEKAARDVAGIEDPELREAFKRLRLVLLKKAQRAGPPLGNKAHQGKYR